MPLAQVGLAQGGWDTANQLPGVDLSGLTRTQRVAALSILRSESCSCGCDMKIAQCRIEDPKCAVSRRLAELVVREASAGKSAKDIRADVVKLASQPPPLLEDKPVAISIAGDPMRGPSDAKVTIVEFSDFQCPYCAKAVGEVNQILKLYPKNVRLVFKQYPLDIHSQAAMAAQAALAAQAQGKFWEMHDKLYANFRIINRDRVFLWAQEIGLDMSRFRADLDSHKYAARIAAESKEGDSVGVEGTPTFYIDGRRLNAGFDVQLVAPLIDQELKRASR